MGFVRYFVHAHLTDERQQIDGYIYCCNFLILFSVAPEFCSKDITRIQKHLKKMFAGITAIDVEEENILVTAINSREGERVQLVNPVNIRVCDFLFFALHSTLRKLDF